MSTHNMFSWSNKKNYLRIITKYSFLIISINSLHAGNFACFFVVCGFFFKLNFSKKYFRNTIRVSNSLDPDQARESFGPVMGPNCVQRLSADDKKHPPP